jgi:hypothetical protein
VFKKNSLSRKHSFFLQQLSFLLELVESPPQQWELYAQLEISVSIFKKKECAEQDLLFSESSQFDLVYAVPEIIIHKKRINQNDLLNIVFILNYINYHA